MKQLTPEILKESVALVDQLRSGSLSDEEISSVVSQLDRLLPDPHWFGYAVDRVPELTAEEVVRKAFSYRPIQL